MTALKFETEEAHEEPEEHEEREPSENTDAGERATFPRDEEERERRARAEEERFGPHKPEKPLPRPVGGSDILIGFHRGGFLTEVFADLLGRAWPSVTTRPG